MKTAFYIFLLGAVAAGIILISGREGGSVQDSVATPSNVSVVDGVQIVEIRAKGGYQPSRTVAEAGLPTIIRFKTAGTYDCSLALRIPSRNVSMFLPQTGSTDVDVGTPTTGVMQGLCSMGMYRFAVEFK